MKNTAKNPTLILDESFKEAARIKVVGVGGGGGNAVNRMVTNGLEGVEFISINTDKLSLDNSLADLKIPIGHEKTKGLGAGAKPGNGFDAIQENRKEVEEAIKGADMIFITAGMGGGTGTGAAPVVAEIARELGVLSVAVVTKPFHLEGPVRTRHAEEGIKALRENVDTIVVVENNKVLSLGQKATVAETFGIVDAVLNNAVLGICEIILTHGFMQVDFADVRTVMENGGDALMGTGTANGENKALMAAETAISSPLLEDVNINGASHVLINITHGPECAFEELNTIMTYIYESVGEENQPSIIWGDVEKADWEDDISVTVIATGFKKEGEQFVEEYSSMQERPQETPSIVPQTQETEVVQSSPSIPLQNENVEAQTPPTIPMQFEQNATGNLRFGEEENFGDFAEESIIESKPVSAQNYSEKLEINYKKNEEIDFESPSFLRNQNNY